MRLCPKCKGTGTFRAKPKAFTFSQLLEKKSEPENDNKIEDGSIKYVCSECGGEGTVGCKGCPNDDN